MWHDCRECLLEAARHVAGCAADAPVGTVLAGLHRRAAAERSLRNFLRWTLRAGAFRPPVCAFDPPEVSVAGMLYRHLAVGENPSGCPPPLYRLWCKFN